jgi:hypothetical protein
MPNSRRPDDNGLARTKMRGFAACPAWLCFRTIRFHLDLGHRAKRLNPQPDNNAYLDSSGQGDCQSVEASASS